jgi:hypothetical protein
MDTITPELRQAVENAGDSPLRLVDPEAHRSYVVVDAEAYDRLRDEESRREHALSLRVKKKSKAQLRARVDRQERQLGEMAMRMERAEALLGEKEYPPIVVPISTLAPEPFDLIGPVVAVVQETEGRYVASFLDANLGASGETKTQALDGLKDRIVTTFERLERKSDEQLGVGPRRQKRVLAGLIRRR